MIELPRPPFDLAEPRIEVFGIGNAGSNALDRIVLDGPNGLSLVAVNTDAQRLAGSVAPTKVQIGQTITRGLGAGGDPDLGKNAAEEGIGEILASLANVNIVVLVVGLGGGTGSGAAPVIAEVAREHGALVIVVATIPFAFEGKRRLAQAEEALASLRQTADILICFENDKMGDAVAPNAPIQEAFAEADRTISQVVRSVAGLAGRKGLVHLGFDELTGSFRGQNQRCVFGTGEATGDNRANEALEAALKSPLLGRGQLKENVENVVVSITGGPDLTLHEVTTLMQEFQRHVGDSTRTFFGAAVEPGLEGKLAVTILGSFEVAPPAQVSAPVMEEVAPSPRIMPRRQPEPEYVAPQEAEPEYYPTEDVVAEEVVEEPVASEEVAAEPEPEPAPVAPGRTIIRPIPPRPPGPRPPLSAPKLPLRPPREVRAEQMQLEPINRGRFEKSEPTIIDGQDLDVPTFLRRNIKQ